MVHCRASHIDAGILRLGILLEFRGDLDMAGAPRSHRCLIDAVESGDFVIVDLTEVGDIDESGLYALGAALRESRELGRDFILIAEPASRAGKALVDAGITSSVRVFDSLQGAVTSARSEALAAAS